MLPTRSFQVQIFLGLVILLMVFSFEVNAQEKQKAEILAVLSEKSEAYFRGDIEKWKSYYIQDSLTSRSIITRFGYSEQLGWPNVESEVIRNSKEEEPYEAIVTHKNVHIRILGNMAYAQTDEGQKLPKNAPVTDSSYTRTYSVLVYENQKWKIANQIRFGPQTYDSSAPYREYVLNAMGYELIAEKRINEAIDIFILTVKQNPNSWNAYDSLGEAYALAGETKLAIANYAKSIELNPKNEDGKKKLESLKMK